MFLVDLVLYVHVFSSSYFISYSFKTTEQTYKTSVQLKIGKSSDDSTVGRHTRSTSSSSLSSPVKEYQVANCIISVAISCPLYLTRSTVISSTFLALMLRLLMLCTIAVRPSFRNVLTLSVNIWYHRCFLIRS